MGHRRRCPPGSYQLQTLSRADAIGALINKFLDPAIDLSPAGIDNHAMGTVFEELVRKFNEENNEEAGEHWTPRDAVRLMANLVFLPIENELKSGTYLLYDCACGTGGMLTVAEETLTAIAAKRAPSWSTNLTPTCATPNRCRYWKRAASRTFIRREVLPYTPDAWIRENATKIGYEVSFTRHFYKPQPLRSRRRDQRRQDERAPYGKRILATVSRELTVEFGQAFTLRSLYRAIQFCQGFTDREIVSTLSTQLSWSHFIELLPIKDTLARDFYAEMCRIERWDVRTLRLKIGGMLFQRTALSKKPQAVISAEIGKLRDGQMSPDTVFRDPYLLDLLGLKGAYSERDLESAILREIEGVLLELGTGFALSLDRSA